MTIHREGTSRGFRNVLAATDLSARAALAVHRAARMPLRPRARLEILHVIPQGLPARKQIGVARDARAGLERLAISATEAARAAGNPKLIVTTAVMTGQPFVEIVRRARSSDADLLVVGRHGASMLRDLFSIGSTAERVIRTGETAVLVAGLPPDRPHRRPLVALELEDTAPRILDLALRAIGEEVRQISIVHAFHIPFESFTYPSVSSGKAQAQADELRRRATAAIEKMIAARHASGIDWKIAVRKGEPAGVVISQVARMKADLLVLGTHGRSGIAHALLGSVAESVIKGATSDVLVTRPARFSFELP